MGHHVRLWLIRADASRNTSICHSPDNFVSFDAFIKIDASLCPVLSSLLALNAVNAIYYPYACEFGLFPACTEYIHTTGAMRRDYARVTWQMADWS